MMCVSKICCVIIYILIVNTTRHCFCYYYTEEQKACVEEIRTVFKHTIDSKPKHYAKQAFLNMRSSDDPTKDTFTNVETRTVLQYARKYYDHMYDFIQEGNRFRDYESFCSFKEELYKKEIPLIKTSCLGQLVYIGLIIDNKLELIKFIYKNIVLDQIDPGLDMALEYIDLVATAFRIEKPVKSPPNFCLDTYPFDPNNIPTISGV